MKVSSHDQLQNSIMKIPDASLGGGEGLLNPQFLVTGTTGFTIPVGFFGIVKVQQNTTDTNFFVNGYEFVHRNVSSGLNLIYVRTPPLAAIIEDLLVLTSGQISSPNGSDPIIISGAGVWNRAGYYVNTSGVTKTFRAVADYSGHQFSGSFIVRRNVTTATPPIKGVAESVDGDVLGTAQTVSGFSMTSPDFILNNGDSVVFSNRTDITWNLGFGNFVRLFLYEVENTNSPSGLKSLRLREGDVISGGRYVVELYQL